MSGDVRAVAVFGSSEPPPGSGPYEEARQVGALLARRGWTVVNGGYGGVMEAASRGARESGGRAVGVTSDLFATRGGGNRWLSEELREEDLFARTRRLVLLSDAFLVLPGRAGTLAELAFLWALDRAGALGPRPTVLLGRLWAPVMQELREHGILQEAQIRGTRLAASPQAAVELIALGLTSFERFRSGELPE